MAPYLEISSPVTTWIAEGGLHQFFRSFGYRDHLNIHELFQGELLQVFLREGPLVPVRVAEIKQMK
ncbi:MAG: hypothetical protein WDN75_19580 [Bacteroidota bacterium]